MKAPEALTFSPLVRAPAAAARPRVLVRMLSFPVMLAVALMALTFITARSRFDDPDMWWHLRLGKIIWTSHAIPRTDQFSFTTGNHPWIPHEWLAQLSIYAAYQSGGYRGLMLWLCLPASLIFALLYVLCSLYSGNAKVALLGGLVGWFFGTVGLAIRPLILGHLFLVLELLALHLGRTRNRWWLWTLPPLFALWVNCHASYALGLLVLGIFVFSSFVHVRSIPFVSLRWGRLERRRLCAVFLLCGVALLANPAGPTVLTYPVNVFTRQSASLASVSEWRPADASDARGVGLFALAGVIGLVLLVRPVALRLEEALLLLLGFAMALRHTRMLFVFGILVAPILCRLLADAWDNYEPHRDHRAVNAFFILAALATVVLSFPRLEQLDQQVKDASPVEAVKFIRQSGISGPMLNAYEWGGYLIWALPEQKVFIDGRADVFDWTGVLGEYGRWALLEENPSLLLEKYGIQYCLLRKGAPMTFVLPYLPGWYRAYEDQLAVVFVRRPAG